MTSPALGLSAFVAFWAETPCGREAYEERPSALLALATGARREDPSAFDAFLIAQIGARAPESLLVAAVSVAQEVTAALRARLADATGQDRARIAELLAARGAPDEARALLLDMLGGPDAPHAAWPLKRLGGADALDPALDALAVAHGESARRDLRELALHLAGFSGSLHRTIEWALGEADPRVRGWGIAELRRAVADRGAGRAWPAEVSADSPALNQLIQALRSPGDSLEVAALEGAERWVAQQVLVIAHLKHGDPRAVPALRALGGELAVAVLAEA